MYNKWSSIIRCVQNYEFSISLVQVSDTGGGGGGLLQGDLNGVHYSLPGL